MLRPLPLLLVSILAVLADEAPAQAARCNQGPIGLDTYVHGFIRNNSCDAGGGIHFTEHTLDVDRERHVRILLDGGHIIGIVDANRRLIDHLTGDPSPPGAGDPYEGFSSLEGRLPRGRYYVQVATRHGDAELPPYKLQVISDLFAEGSCSVLGWRRETPSRSWTVALPSHRLHQRNSCWLTYGRTAVIRRFEITDTSMVRVEVDGPDGTKVRFLSPEDATTFDATVRGGVPGRLEFLLEPGHYTVAFGARPQERLRYRIIVE